MPRTSKSKARNKKVHTEIEPAAPFQALLKPHETCDLLVPSKESPISLPTPLLLLYEFHWFLCHKGEEKGLSVYQAHTYFFFSPTLKLFFFLSRNPMQLKCLYLPLFFLYHPKQEDFHSLFSFREERNSKAAQCTLLEMERWKGVALNEPGAEELCGDHFKHKFSYVWLSSCDRIKPSLPVTSTVSASQPSLRHARLQPKGVCKTAAWWSSWGLTLHRCLVILHCTVLLQPGEKRQGKRSLQSSNSI